MFELKIITPSGPYDMIDNALGINYFSPAGEIGILSNHMPIVSMVEVSRLSVKTDQGWQYYAVGEGLFYFENNLATILVESVVRKDKIDLRSLEKEKEELTKLLLLSDKDKENNLKKLKIIDNKIEVAQKD